MNTALSSLLSLNQFSTGRRLFAFYRVLEVAKSMQAAVVEALVTSAIAADEATYELELRWAKKRRTGKPSAKQVKAQRALQKTDNLVDKALSGLRDGAISLIKAADPEEEKELINDVEHFLDAIFPNGVQAVTNLPYDEQSIAVKAIVGKLAGELAALVTKLGLQVNVDRLTKLSARYAEELTGVDTLEFGNVMAAREAGQGFLLRVTAKIIGTYDEPTGEGAQKRAALLGPIVKQNEAISDYVRARRSVPEVDPKTGEEHTPEATPEAGDAPDAEKDPPAPKG